VPSSNGCNVNGVDKLQISTPDTCMQYVDLQQIICISLIEVKHSTNMDIFQRRFQLTQKRF